MKENIRCKVCHYPRLVYELQRKWAGLDKSMAADGVLLFPAGLDPSVYKGFINTLV